MKPEPDSCVTISSLQEALDGANNRIRELEFQNRALTLRLYAANDRADELEGALWRLPGDSPGRVNCKDRCEYSARGNNRLVGLMPAAYIPIVAACSGIRPKAASHFVTAKRLA